MADISASRAADVLGSLPDNFAAADCHESIEERCFSAALLCLEGHYIQCPPMGPLTAAQVNSIISKTLEKTHTLRTAREALSRNVEIWIWLTKIFAAAIPSLNSRSVGPLSSLNDLDKGVSPQESTAFIVMNHVSIKEDLGTLIKLMHIARNLLVNAEPEVPQDLCAAVHFDQMVYQTIILCVNVTSKGYDGEILDDSQRLKLTEITELYKKLLVTSLQQAHNWTAKHDRNKMSFWLDVLFDDYEGYFSGPEEGVGDSSGFRPDVAKQQVQHWLERNYKMCDTACKLLKSYVKNHAHKPPGNLESMRPLAWNWLPEPFLPESATSGEDDGKFSPVWKPDEEDKFEQDRAYGRVSREIDTWWLRACDPNYDSWVVGIPSVEFAQTRTEHCKSNLIHRYAHSYQGEQSSSPDETEDVSEREPCHCSGGHDLHLDGRKDDDDGYDNDASEDDLGCEHHHHHHHHHQHHHHHHHHRRHQYNHHHSHQQHHGDGDRNEEHDERVHDHGHEYGHEHEHEHEHDHNYVHNFVDDLIDDDADDEASYGELPLTGLLTEVPNILDPKQIEALHMIVKSCVLENAGSSLTRVGENLQKTRCRMFVALDCGKSLLRELLVFIAVWDKDEQSLIFQVTAQIVEGLYHNALLPYTWNSLRIAKDIISPAQTVLLRLINHMFRARAHGTATQDGKELPRDVQITHFLFSFFRSRIVPECAALMHLQAQIREKNCDPSEFPVDSWDMERARDGLAQYLEFLTAAAEVPQTKTLLIEWDAVYDLITLLSGLEAGVQKKSLIELPKRSSKGEKSNPMVERPYSTQSNSPSPSPPPQLMQEPAHRFPWSGIKGQIFTILATLLHPPPGQTSPGDPQVQMQMMKHNGIVPLLNCCAYDDHNPFAKERVTICLKWLLDGCEAANNFFRELVSFAPQPSLKSPPSGSTCSTLRVDGVRGEVNVMVRSSTAPCMGGVESSSSSSSSSNLDSNADLLDRAARLSLGAPSATSRGSVEEDFMA